MIFEYVGNTKLYKKKVTLFHFEGMTPELDDKRQFALKPFLLSNLSRDGWKRIQRHSAHHPQREKYTKQLNRAALEYKRR